MIDVVALGELLIDFTPAGKSKRGNLLFEQNPGGAPANVLTAIVRQGGSGALISAVGDDEFGHYLHSVIQKEGVCTRGLQFTHDAATTLAFVRLSKTGDRTFSFCRKPGADQKIKKELFDLSLIDQCKIFHFGSLSLSDEPSRSSTIYAAEYAKEKGKLISYDPNWRPPLWENKESGLTGMKLGLPYADILKLSEEELSLLSGNSDLFEGTKALSEQYQNLRLIVVTLGSAGCFYRLGTHTGKLPTYDTNIMDTTGAGDAFWGALLLKIAQNPNCIADEQEEYLCTAMDFANASGALCASGRGAIPSVPTLQEVEDLRKSRNLLSY